MNVRLVGLSIVLCKGKLPTQLFRQLNW